MLAIRSDMNLAEKGADAFLTSNQLLTCDFPLLVPSHTHTSLSQSVDIAILALSSEFLPSIPRLCQFQYDSFAGTQRFSYLDLGKEGFE